MLEGGANAAHVLCDGRSALFVAAASGCSGIVELLLNAMPAALPKKKKDGTSTPTSTIASTTSSSDVNDDDDDKGNAGGSGARKLKSLIDGANSDGETPLYVSAANGHARVLEALLEHGARVDYAPKALSMTPLLVASAQGERGFGLIWCFEYENRFHRRSIVAVFFLLKFEWIENVLAMKFLFLSSFILQFTLTLTISLSY